MGSERVLPTRKRKLKQGLIRVSPLVWKTLDRGRGKISWDDWLRYLLGLPDKKGYEQRCVEGMLETTTGLFILKLPDSTWEEIEVLMHKVSAQVAFNKNLSRPNKPIRMRELR
jgi:hypothetical protein